MTIFRIDDQSKKKERQSKSDSMRSCDKPLDKEDVGGVKRFYGDGLFVRMHSNHRLLEITGDGCRVILSRNSGSVHIVGDGCRLRVNHNVGDIEYTGDGGRILLGPDSSKGKVKFVGDGGKVILDSCPDTESKRSSTGAINGETGRAEKIICRCKKICDKTPKWEKCENDREISNREDTHDIVRQRSREEYGKGNEETRKSLWHPTVTKIITKIQSDGQCVTKRFGDSSLIVNIRGDGRPVAKSVPGASDTNIEIK